LSRNWAFWQQYGPYLALATALTAMLGSLYYSEIAGFVPCTLCWYQRILMYPLTLIMLAGIVKQDRSLPDYVLPFSVIGTGVSTYHYLIQLGIVSHSNACSVGIPCGLRYVNYLGFVTIPFMALTAFVIITGTTALTKWAHRRADRVDSSTEM
jgi:disulfide bond formation protein DsbB